MQERRGRIAITVGLPHKCPMIPLEITFAMHGFIRDYGLLDKTMFYYTYPIGRIHSLKNVAQWAAPEFDRMGIQYETLFNMKEVDGQNVLILGDMTNIPISKARLYHSL